MQIPVSTLGVQRKISGGVRIEESHSMLPSGCDYDCGRFDLACKAREARCRAECPACRVACRSAQAAGMAACAELSGPAFFACEAAAIEAGNQCYDGCC